MPAKKLNELRQELETLVKKVQKEGKTDELEQQMDQMEAVISALKDEVMSEDDVQALKDLLDTVK